MPAAGIGIIDRIKAGNITNLEIQLLNEQNYYLILNPFLEMFSLYSIRHYTHSYESMLKSLTKNTEYLKQNLRES